MKPQSAGGTFCISTLIFLSACLSFCRRSCLRKVFSGSNLKKTGTTPTHPTSTGMEKKVHFTLLLWTKMGRPGMERGQGDIRGSLTSYQGPLTQIEYRSCTGTYWARVETEGALLWPCRSQSDLKATKVHLSLTPSWGRSKILLIWTKQDHKKCTKSTLPTAGMEEQKIPSLKETSLGVWINSTRDLLWKMWRPHDRHRGYLGPYCIVLAYAEDLVGRLMIYGFRFHYLNPTTC